jgi:LPXTG-motif cell wall-anchored protein
MTLRTRILAVVCLATAPLLLAAPAAAELPDDHAIFIDSWYGASPGQLYEVDADTAVATKRGDYLDDRVGGIDVDAGTGLGYLVTVGSDFGEGPETPTDIPAELFKLDTNAGKATAPVSLTDALGDPVFGCFALDLNADGVITSACRENVPELDDDGQAVTDDWGVGTINPVTGRYRAIVTGLREVYALASHPSGTLYAFDRDGAVLEIDRAAGTATVVTTTQYDDGLGFGSAVQAADFDSTGQLWVIPAAEAVSLAQVFFSVNYWPIYEVDLLRKQDGQPVGEAQALTVVGPHVATAPVDPPGTTDGAADEGTSGPDTETAPKPALASTGTDATPLALAGGALLLGGALLVAYRRRRRVEA